MVDLARIGFSVDSSQVDKGVSALNKLTPATQKAEAAAEAFNSAMGRMAGGTSSARGNTARLAEGYDILTGKIDKNFLAISKNIAGWTKLTPAANQAATALDRLGKHASDNINRMQATPGNIAAQFQDIGVTAAGGMSPMLIALQQGTQLSAALAGGIGNLGAAFKQLFGFTTILTIGFVALLAVGIQMVDWAKVTSSALNMLADSIVALSPYLALAAASFALLYAPAILGGIATLTKAMYGLATGILSVIGLPALLVAGFVAMVAALNIFRDEVQQVLGVDVIGAAKQGANFIIGSFVGAFNSIRYTWKMLPGAIGDVVVQAANATVNAIENMVNGAIGRINKLTSMLPFGLGNGLQMGQVDMGEIANPWKGVAANVRDVVGAQMAAARQVDYIGKGVDAIKNGAKIAADYMRGWAKSLVAGDEASKKTGAAKTAGGAGGKTEAEKWVDLLAGADKQMRGLTQAGQMVGVYGEELDRLRFQFELFNKAQDEGIHLTAAMSDELRRRAAEMAKQSASNRLAEFNEKSALGYEEQIRLLQQQRVEIGLTGQALATYRSEQAQIDAARKAGIPESQIDLDLIRQRASEIGRMTAANDNLTESLKRQQEIIGFLRQTFVGFFTEWVQNVRQGQSVFEGFANALLNALNKIIDKALDSALNGLFNASGIAGLFGGGLSSGGIAAANTTVGSTIAANPSLFAKGGTFTNSIVDSPTLFKFAKGTGLMGEAGPEAIMPLKRGSDGSLGVQMHGGSARQAVNNNITNAPTYNVGGVMTPEAIIAAIRQGDEQSRQEIAAALPALLSEYQRNGTTG